MAGKRVRLVSSNCRTVWLAQYIPRTSADRVRRWLAAPDTNIDSSSQSRMLECDWNMGEWLVEWLVEGVRLVNVCDWSVVIVRLSDWHATHTETSAGRV